jgi:urease accessory protein
MKVNGHGLNYTKVWLFSLVVSLNQKLSGSEFLIDVKLNKCDNCNHIYPQEKIMLPRMQTIGKSFLLAVLLSLIPTVVLAHDGSQVPFGGFLAGLVHPVLGYDHLLAMLSVGIISAQIGGRAIWTVPSTFVSVMAIGGLFGFMNLGFGQTELGIAVSLILLGAVIALERRLGIKIAMLIVGFFAIFHGYAHGSEVPTTSEPFLYALGFLTGTALIHIAGVVIGDIAQHYQRGKIILRGGGAAIFLVGILFVFGIL